MDGSFARHAAPCFVLLFVSSLVPARGESPAGGAQPPLAVRFQPPPTAVPPPDGEVAAEPVVAIDPESVAAQLKEVEADPALDPALKQQLVETLQQALKSLHQQVADAKQIASLEKRLATVDTRLAEAKRQSTYEVDEKVAVPGYLPITHLREEKARADQELSAAREALSQVETRIRERDRLNETLPKEINQARQNVSSAEGAVATATPPNSDARLASALAVKRIAEHRAAAERLKLLKQQKTSIEAEADLLPLEKAVAEKRFKQAQVTASAWSNALRERRESQLEAELSRHQAKLKSEGIDPEASLVLKAKDSWAKIVGELSHSEQLIEREATVAQQYLADNEEIEEQIQKNRDAGRSSGASLGLRLQLLQRSLPRSSRLNSEITQLDAKLEDVQRELNRATLILEAVRRGNDGPLSELVPVDLPMKDGEVHPAEKDLLDRYVRDLREYVSNLIELHSHLETQLAEVSKLRQKIDTQVMWLPNHPRFAIDELRQSWFAVTQMVQLDELATTGQALLAGLLGRIDLLVLLVIAVGTLAIAGQRLRRRLIELGKAASPMRVVTLRPTWSALLLTVALSLPLPLLLWVLGRALEEAPIGEVNQRALAMGFQLAAAVVLPIELLRQVMRRGGLYIAHFAGVESTVKPLRQGLRLLIDAGIPLILVWSVAFRLDAYHFDQSLGRVVFCLGMFLISGVIWRSIDPTKGLFSKRLQANANGWGSRLRYLWMLALVGLPLSLIVLSLSGYSFAAQTLAERLYWTVWLGTIAVIAFGFVHRWLLTQRRSVAMAAREQRIAAREAGTDIIDMEDEVAIDLSQINEQTSRLILAIFVTIAVVGLAYTWSPVLPAIRYLERFQFGTVTLANVVHALPIMILTWVAVRNLPGLMEGMLLERLPLQKAARYAITTLTTYALVAIGVTSAAATLGFRWENIQWLVAALGVGLGFGLQEIFANFVSGLILLFEQPIRVGDIVTLGETTGAVSRIRMRATTVTNWDRQELVIPNKDLITGRLINWTLSDSMNRVVLNIGVAYGSDTRRACDLLREVCNENANVASDPAPLVTFEGFGDSTLNLVVRCYLSSLENRLATIHDLHTNINDRFNDQGIEIAFPQRDLHLRSIPAELVRVPASADSEKILQEAAA